MSEVSSAWRDLYLYQQKREPVLLSFERQVDLHENNKIIRSRFVCVIFDEGFALIKYHAIENSSSYRKVPIVATLVTFRISSVCGSLLSRSRYFQGGRYFRGTKTMKQASASSFLRNEKLYDSRRAQTTDRIKTTTHFW